MRVVFLGTPGVAAVALRALLESKHEAVAVVTQPDRPRGRSGAALPSPVKEVALGARLPVLQPESPKDVSFAAELSGYAPQALAVVAYGHILPQDVLEVAPAINAHFSLLPRYRGAAPVQRAVLAGERTTGVTTFLLEPSVDSGPMLLQEEVSIGEDDTAGELLERLALVGARLLLASLDGLEAGSLELRVQDPSQASPAPKIKPDEAEIEWSKPAAFVRNQVRAFNPSPGAWTTHEERRFKVWRAKTMSPDQQGKPGEILSGSSLIVACGEGALELTEVQPEGKRRMTGGDFLRGLRPNTSRTLGPKTWGS